MHPVKLYMIDDHVHCNTYKPCNTPSFIILNWAYHFLKYYINIIISQYHEMKTVNWVQKTVKLK